MMNQETIHIRKLTTGYPGKGGTKIVAKDIDATIRSGELTCLLGANGVGKSTLLRTLSAFQPAVGGEIEIMGKKLTDYTDKQLATVIGVVLTEKCSLRNMTVEELVGMGRSPYGERKNYIRTDIPHFTACRCGFGDIGNGYSRNSFVSCSSGGLLSYSDWKSYFVPTTSHSDCEIYFIG